jgi:hypothetical protein
LLDERVEVFLSFSEFANVEVTVTVDGFFNVPDDDDDDDDEEDEDERGS